MATHNPPSEPQDQPAIVAPPPPAAALAPASTRSPSASASHIPPPPSAPPKQPSKDFLFLPIPRRLRWDPENPPAFGWGMNVIFAAAASVGVANMNYAQPILVALADEFNVDYAEVTNIPTLLQASYAAGLLFICPLGDLVRRRQLILAILIVGSALSLSLAFIKNINAFQVISAFLGASSVAGQVLIPLAIELAPATQRGTAVAIVFGGLTLGSLYGRVLAGLVGEKSIAGVYYMAFGLQKFILVLLWAVLPDFPAKNQGSSYKQILVQMGKYAITEPLLIQACIIVCSCSAVFSSFWVTQTFILSDIYGFSSLKIGLFALVGVGGVFTAPIIGRIVDTLLPWTVTCLGLLVLMMTQAVFTGAVGTSIGALIVVIIGLDIGWQLQEVSYVARIMEISHNGRARISAVYVLFIFIGQLIGTSAGSRVYLKWGYRASGGLCIGLLGFAMLVHCLRGPHTGLKTVIGWEGGSGLRRKMLADPEDQGVANDEENAVEMGKVTKP